MATYTYPHAVKANGEIIPPNTPVELDAEAPNTTEAAKVEAPAKKTARKKKE